MVWKERRLEQLVVQNLIKLFTVGLWKRQAGTDVLISKADTQTNKFSQTFIYERVLMNIYLLVYIFATFIWKKSLFLADKYDQSNIAVTF